MVMHVMDDVSKVERFGNVSGTKVPELTIKGEQQVKKAVDLGEK